MAIIDPHWTPPLDLDQSNLDPILALTLASKCPAPDDVVEVLLGARPGSWCTIIDGEDEVGWTPSSLPPATLGLVPYDVQLLLCSNVEDGDGVAILVL